MWERREIKEPVVRWWEVVGEDNREEGESGSTVQNEWLDCRDPSLLIGEPVFVVAWLRKPGQFLPLQTEEGLPERWEPGSPESSPLVGRVRLYSVPSKTW